MTRTKRLTPKLALYLLERGWIRIRRAHEPTLWCDPLGFVPKCGSWEAERLQRIRDVKLTPEQVARAKANARERTKAFRGHSRFGERVAKDGGK